MEYRLHVQQPSTDISFSPPTELSPSFLSTSDALPSPSRGASPRKSTPLRKKVGGESFSGRRRSSSRDRGRTLSSLEEGGSRGRRPSDTSLPFASFLSETTRSMSLSRPSTLLLPGSIAIFLFSLLVSTYDTIGSFSRARRLRVDPAYRQLDFPGEQPGLGWRTANEVDWWTKGSKISPWDFDELGAMRDGGWGGRGEDGKVRILVLTGFSDWLERMNSHTPEVIEASFAHPWVETDVWGPNWGGWDAKKTISENLKVRRVWREVGNATHPERQLSPAGPGYYDLVWTFSDIFHMDDPSLDSPGHGTLFAQQLGDCHSDDCINKWYAPILNITTFKYPHEAEDMFAYERIKSRFPEMEMHLFGHSADSANRWDFYPPPRWEDKKIDTQGFGYDGSFYPIRTTITNALKQSAKSGTDIKWHPHPGYSISRPEDVKAPEFYPKKSPLHETHRELRADFAAGMRNTKICVFDSSLERKMIRKWAQALLSGCVVAGDIPTDREDELREFMIELKQGWPIEKINAVLEEALTDQEGLKRKAMLGLAYARSYLTNGKKVEGMLRLWNGYKNLGWRGYHFTTGHSLKCRQYWSGETSYRPEWCKGQGHMGLEGEWDRSHVFNAS